MITPKGASQLRLKVQGGEGGRADARRPTLPSFSCVLCGAQLDETCGDVEILEERYVCITSRPQEWNTASISLRRG